MPARDIVLGSPHAYYLSAASALGQPLFAAPDDRADALRVLEAVRATWDARLHAYALHAGGLHLVLALGDHRASDLAWLRARWRGGGGSPALDGERLRARLGSLSGFMQTLLQRISRGWNARHGGRGRLWAQRYRACLLADDAALLAASAWLESECASGAVASSRDGAATPRLAAPPLRIGPDEQWFAADDSPPGLPPPPADALRPWLARISAELGPEVRAVYGAALAHGWALGRPESLAAPLARLGRSGGRGRSRQLRHLEDALGLCGVWG